MLFGKSKEKQKKNIIFFKKKYWEHLYKKVLPINKKTNLK